MIKQSTDRLDYLCQHIPPLLFAISETEFAYKQSLEKWSKKEILGHLIDSATNNHQRFVRCQFEDMPTITYDQNKWNKSSHYNELSKDMLILFWSGYNRFLSALIRQIPDEKLTRQCNTGGDVHLTLAELVTDYVAHMEHHLKQLVK